MVWVFSLTYAPRALSRRLREGDPTPPWENILLVAWTGMRGAVSLAAALALPLETDTGAPFPERDLIIFLTFSVIFATLVLQGLSLPPLIRALGVEDDGLDQREEERARLEAAQAALSRIDELTDEDWVRNETAERVRGLYEYRRRRFGVRVDGGDGADIEHRSSAYQRLQREIIESQRETLVRLRNERVISDEVMRRSSATSTSRTRGWRSERGRRGERGPAAVGALTGRADRLGRPRRVGHDRGTSRTPTDADYPAPRMSRPRRELDPGRTIAPARALR